jgi:hypothetical protein
LGQVHDSACPGTTPIPAASWAHEPPQFFKHSDCEHDTLLGQIHDPACPKAIPIPASSRTIETIASFFILYHSTHLMNVARSQQLMITIAYDDLDLGKILGTIKRECDLNWKYIHFLPYSLRLFSFSDYYSHRKDGKGSCK